MKAFVHEATLEPAADFDERAPGAAITVALCGRWEHEGPCRWPHHTSAERSGNVVSVRTLFACDWSEEETVRGRIRSALQGGRLAADDGAVSSWSLVETGPGQVRVEEASHAQRLAASD